MGFRGKWRALVDAFSVPPARDVSAFVRRRYELQRRGTRAEAAADASYQTLINSLPAFEEDYTPSRDRMLAACSELENLLADTNPEDLDHG